MNDKPDGPGLDPAIAAKLFPDRPVDEVVADIVAANPEKHGMTLEERIRRAKAAAVARGSAADEEEALYRACVTELAHGDPDEMLPGNKPRYTVDDDGNVKDHDTGKIHYLSAPPVGAGASHATEPGSIPPHAGPADAEGQ